MEALKHGRLLEKRRAHLNEIPTAQLAQIYYNSQKTEPPYKDTNDFFWFEEEDLSQAIPVKVAALIMALIREESMPGWAVEILPMQEIKQKGQQERIEILEGMVWMCPNVMFLLPKVDVVSDFKVLKFAMGVFNFPKSGKVQVWDIVKRVAYNVFISPKIDGMLLKGQWFYDCNT